MASLTEDQLREKLAYAGIDASHPGLKKDDLVQLYEDNILNSSQEEMAAAEELVLSSDDEEVQNLALKKKSASKSSRRSNASAAKVTKANDSQLYDEPLTEDNSLIVNEMNVEALTDEELFEKLVEAGVDVGPIVDSTRYLYQKKLAILLRGGEKSVNNTTNGNHDETDANGVNGEETVEERESKMKKLEQLSADESEDSEQPSAVIERQPTPVKKSPTRTSIRNRFNKTEEQDETRSRFTPTPRRSIHSYKKTVETTKQTMTKLPDGQVTHDYSYTREESGDAGEREGSAVAGLLGNPAWTQRPGVRKILAILPKLFLVLIVLMVAYATWKQQSASSQPSVPKTRVK